MLNFIYNVCEICITILKAIKEKITKYMFLCTGLFWIFFYLYLRLIATREGYEILNLKNEITYFGIFIFIIILIINFLCILVIICFWFDIGLKTGSLSFLSEFKTVFNFLYLKPLESVYAVIENKVPGSGDFFLFLERKCLTPLRDGIFNDFYYNFAIFLIVFVFDILPKFILCITFFVETVFFGQVKYFFVFMPLFLVPIALKIFLKLLKSCGVSNMPTALFPFKVFEGVGKPYCSEDGSFYYYEYYRCRMKSGYGYLDLNEAVEFVVSLQNFIRHEWKIRRCLDIATSYTIFITSLLYFIGGLTRIIIICF